MRQSRLTDVETLALAHGMWCVWQREQRVLERATFSRWLQSLRGC